MMQGDLKAFLEPENLARLAAFRLDDYPTYMEMLSGWFTRLGSATGLSISGLDGVVKVAGPRLLEDMLNLGPEEVPMDTVLHMPKANKVWVVDGLLFGGGMSILAADPKAGKTTLARWLATCVMAGAPFAGRDCRPGRVLYYCLEDPDHVMAEDMQAFGRHHKLGWDRTEGSFTVFHRRATGDIINRMATTIEEYKINLVVIDTLVRFLGLQEGNDYGATTLAMDRLKKPLTVPGSWAQRNTHILALHHNNKAGGGGDPYKGQLGSASFRGSTDLNMTITVSKDEKRKLHRTEGRVKNQLGPLQIIKRDSHLEFLGITDDDDDRNNLRYEAVLDILRDNPGCSKAHVQKALKELNLGLGNSHWSGMWNSMAEDGVISVESKGLRSLI